MIRMAVPAVALLDQPARGCTRRRRHVDPPGGLRRRAARAAAPDSSRARMSFWMLPPERLRAGVSRPGVFTVERGDQLAAVPPDVPRPQEPPPRVRGVRAWSTSIRLSADRELADHAVTHPFLGDVAETRRRRIGGPAAGHLGRRSTGSSRTTSGRSPATASASSRWPFPDTPAMPTISPARTSRLRPRTASMPRSPATARSLTDSRSAGDSPRPERRPSVSSTSRPTIMFARSRRVTSAGRHGSHDPSVRGAR